MLFKSILKWLGPWLLKQLIPVLDPDAAERAKALDAKIAAIEQREEEAAVLQAKSDAEYEASQRQFEESKQRRAELDAQHTQLQLEIEVDEQKLRESETRREEIRSAVEKAKSDIDSTPDDVILSGALPGSKPGSEA